MDPSEVDGYQKFAKICTWCAAHLFYSFERILELRTGVQGFRCAKCVPFSCFQAFILWHSNKAIESPYLSCANHLGTGDLHLQEANMAYSHTFSALARVAWTWGRTLSFGHEKWDEMSMAQNYWIRVNRYMYVHILHTITYIVYVYM